MPPRVGLTLQPDLGLLGLVEPLFAEHVDYFEVTPETTWRRADDGRWVPNGFHREFLRLGATLRKPFVAHAVDGSFGTADPRDRARQAAWQQRIADDHARFQFLWVTDHLGAAVLDQRAVMVPIALPMNDAMAAIVCERLVALQQVVPDTGFENSVFYFLLGDWLDEPAFFGKVLAAERTHLLLDLHNVFTMAQNVGADPYAYLARLDGSRVIEIHVSGGAMSDPQWLPSRRSLRLDGHDTAVPEPVWQLLEHVLPRCPNVRGVTLERMAGTVGPGDVDGVRDELVRIREVVRARC